MNPPPQSEYSQVRSSSLKVYAVVVIVLLLSIVALSIIDAFNRQVKEIQAGVLMTLPLFLVSICGFSTVGLLALSFLVSQFKGRLPTLTDVSATHIRPVPSSQVSPLAPLEPIHRLPPPTFADIPVMNYRGKRVPYGMLNHAQQQWQDDDDLEVTFEPEPQQDISTLILRTKTEAGKTVSISAKLLERFCKCATPARKEWSGDKQHYSTCLQFVEAHGLIEQAGNGYVWRKGYTGELRQKWIDGLITTATQRTPPTTSRAYDDQE